MVMTIKSQLLGWLKHYFDQNVALNSNFNVKVLYLSLTSCARLSNKQRQRGRELVTPELITLLESTATDKGQRRKERLLK